MNIFCWCVGESNFRFQHLPDQLNNLYFNLLCFLFLLLDYIGYLLLKDNLFLFIIASIHLIFCLFLCFKLHRKLFLCFSLALSLSFIIALLLIKVYLFYWSFLQLMITLHLRQYLRRLFFLYGKLIGPSVIYFTALFSNR